MSILGFVRGTDAARSRTLENNNEELFNAIKAEENLAIRIINERVMAYLLKKTQRQQSCQQGWAITFHQEDFESIAQDAVMVLLDRIRNGKYTYQGNTPVTYAIEVATYKVKEYRARKCNSARVKATDDEQIQHLVGTSFEKEQIQQLRVCIEKIGDPCKSLFKLRLEGFSWAEVFQKWQNNEIERKTMQNVNTHGGLENNFANNCMPSLRTLFFNTKF